MIKVDTANSTALQSNMYVSVSSVFGKTVESHSVPGQTDWDIYLHEADRGPELQFAVAHIVRIWKYFAKLAFFTLQWLRIK